ncbi:MAG TPA: hypothetical protein VGA48_10215 [Thermoplasmata archaeon]
MYPTNSGTGGRVLGAGHLAAASLGIGLPIATTAVLIAALFSPALWTSVPLVMLAVFVANLANLLVFIGLHRARAGPEPFRSALGVGAVLSGICLSAVLVLAGWFARLGA